MTLDFAVLADRLEARDNEFASPGALALHIEPRTVWTPALQIFDDVLVDAAEMRAPLVLLSMPPQEGKSERCSRNFPLWMLKRNPDLRVASVSASDLLARRWGRAVRDDIANHPELGLRISNSSSAANEWKLVGHDGGMITTSIGGSLTGRPVDVLVIDDPFKDMQDADSETMRRHVKEWWQMVGSTRLPENAIVIVVQCMTGDTSVLMADGTERPLRDIRPGNQVATYEKGKITYSTVRNWANQGPDAIYSIRMKSGVVVRANARHPFLTIEGGKEVWQRTDLLKKGSVILRATGGNGVESPAPRTDAMPRPSARACACLTTTSSVGKTECDRRPLTRSPVEGLTCATGTASSWTTMSACSSSRVGSAPSAEIRQLQEIPELTGMANSALTMTTTQASCEVCSATTAISPLATESRPRFSELPLTTYRVEYDEVVEVLGAGVEDVYDLQIDRTENFIANGLVSHNTRWHQDDLIGWMRIEYPDDWRYINIMAQYDDSKTQDPLGRELGEFMVSARGRTPKGWELRKRNAGSRGWNALYQGRPAPAEGGIFKRDWWVIAPFRRALKRSDGRMEAIGCDQVIISVDCAFKDTDGSDFVVMQVWGRRGAQAYLLDQVRGRMDFPGTCAALVGLSARWPQATLKLVEDKANGPAVIQQLRGKVGGLVPYSPVDSKLARANAVAPFAESRNIEIPDPKDAPWVGDWIEEMAAFPNGTHDDQVDCATQALIRLFIAGGSLQSFMAQVRAGQ